MSKVKYIISIIIIISGFLFTGELCILHLDNFQESYYRASFAFIDIPEIETNSKMVEEFLDVSKRTDVDFFVVYSNIISDYKKEITIYGTNHAITHLKSKGILEKTYSSLFVGDTKVTYRLFSEIPNIKSIENVYFIGNEEKLLFIRKFKAELIDKYGGGFPKLYGSDKGMLSNLLFVWGSIFVLISFLTLYEVFYQKKETVILLLFGENLKHIYLKNILIDIGIFTLVFYSTFKGLMYISEVNFQRKYVNLLFLGFLIVNMLIHTLIFKVNLKKDFANSKSSLALIGASYSLKIVTTVITIMLLTSNIGILFHGFNYYLQSDFFEKHKDYSYYRFCYKINNNLGKSDQDSHFVYQKFYNKYQNQSLQYIDLTGNMGITYPLILINRESKKELKNSISELEGVLENTNEEKLYVIIPEKMLDKVDELENIEEYYNYVLGIQFKENNERITYNEPINLIGIKHRVNPYTSKTMKNPIILLDNTVRKFGYIGPSHQSYYEYDIMYDISQSEFDSYVKEHQLEEQIMVKTNVLDTYRYNWKIIKRGAKLTLVLSIFLFFLEMGLIMLILKMEYRFNSVEIAIKKVLGYTIFERNKKILLITLGSTIISSIIALILSIVFKMQEGLFLLSSSALVFLVELIFMRIKIKSMEKEKIPIILKGERI